MAGSGHNRRAPGRGRRVAHRRGGDPPGPVPDGLPVDPGHRRIVPAAGHRGVPSASWCWSPEPAGRRRRGGVRPGDTGRLPAVGVGQPVRLQGGPHHGRDRRRRGGGGRVRGAGRAGRPPAAIRPPVPTWCAPRPGGRLAGRGRPRRRGGHRRPVRGGPGAARRGGRRGGRPAGGRAARGPAGHRGAEDHHDQRHHRAHQRQGLDPVLVRAGYRRPGRPAPGPARSTGPR